MAFFDIDENIQLSAHTAAVHEVKGFLLHDDKDYNGAAENFFESSMVFFDHLNENDVREAAKEKVMVLKEHDIIEEDPKLTKEERLEDPRWLTKVLPHAQREAELLKIDSRYADEKIKFYSKHGVGNSEFRYNVYEMDKYFTLALTGNPIIHWETAPIYLTCVASHDKRRILNLEKHTPFDTQMMYENYRLYAIHLLNEMLKKEVF